MLWDWQSEYCKVKYSSYDGDLFAWLIQNTALERKYLIPSDALKMAADDFLTVFLWAVADTTNRKVMFFLNLFEPSSYSLPDGSNFKDGVCGSPEFFTQSFESLTVEDYFYPGSQPTGLTVTKSDVGSQIILESTTDIFTTYVIDEQRVWKAGDKVISGYRSSHTRYILSVLPNGWGLPDTSECTEPSYLVNINGITLDQVYNINEPVYFAKSGMHRFEIPGIAHKAAIYCAITNYRIQIYHNTNGWLPLYSSVGIKDGSISADLSELFSSISFS